MTANLIAIGDEILIGQTLDTNTNYIAKVLTDLGLDINSIQTIADKEDAISNAIKSSNADVTIFTGGLGPTKDDITKKTVAQYFNSPLVENPEVLENIKELLASKGKTELNELNRQQALIPEKARPLNNKVGTAPGMWLEDKGKIYVFMPGIPFEMKYLMQNEVVPRLNTLQDAPLQFRQNLLVFNIPESELALQLEDWENQLPTNMSVAYLPTAGVVKMRLTAKGLPKKDANELLNLENNKLQDILGDAIIGREGDDLASIIGSILKAENMNIATAESFTTGRIVTELCSVPGSSAYVKGGIIPYQVNSKENILHVDKSLVEHHKVVSEEMALEMASKAKEMFQCDVALSTTGVAGPTLDENHTEIGLAYVGLQIDDKSWARKYFYPDLERNDFATMISKKALEFLFQKLNEDNYGR